MMTYELFKDMVAERFMDFMPEQYQNMRMEINSVEKVNRILDGISLYGGDKNISPTIYLNEMYDRYLESGDLHTVLISTASAMSEAMQVMPDPAALDFDNAKDNIVFQLINTEQNREMLSGMPHREFQDLSIIYRWVVSIDPGGIQSAVIRNGLAEKLDLSEEQMFQLACENTRRLLPPTVRSMNDVIRDMFLKDGMPTDMIEMMIDEIPADKMMWVISNEKNMNGAISMLYEDKLHDLANRLGTDLYILPSSVHETIAVSADMGDPVELAQMVNEVNMSQVALEERLSNQVYHYDKDLRKLTLATDTPNKRLDGRVAEPQLIYEAKGKSR